MVMPNNQLSARALQTNAYPLLPIYCICSHPLLAQRNTTSNPVPNVRYRTAMLHATQHTHHTQCENVGSERTQPLYLSFLRSDPTLSQTFYNQGTPPECGELQNTITEHIWGGGRKGVYNTRKKKKKKKKTTVNNSTSFTQESTR